MYNVFIKQKRGGEQMSEKDDEILERLGKVIQYMTEKKKGEILGYAQALVDFKENKEKRAEESNEAATH